MLGTEILSLNDANNITVLPTEDDLNSYLGPERLITSSAADTETILHKPSFQTAGIMRVNVFNAPGTPFVYQVAYLTNQAVVQYSRYSNDGMTWSDWTDSRDNGYAANADHATSADNANTVDNFHIVKKTQAEYDAIVTKDANTIYIIVG
jgi:hypothetical protein